MLTNRLVHIITNKTWTHSITRGSSSRRRVISSTTYRPAPLGLDCKCEVVVDVVTGQA